MCILYLQHTQFRLATFLMLNSHILLVAKTVDDTGLKVLKFTTGTNT